MLHKWLGGSAASRIGNTWRRGSVSALLLSSRRHVGSASKSRNWESREEQKAFLDEVATSMNITEVAGWKSVTAKEVEAMGGGGLLRVHGSLHAALAALLPDAGDVLEYRPQVARHHWSNREHRKEFLDRVARHAGLPCTSDWRQVSRKQVVDQGGAGLLAHFTSFADALRDTYGPDVKVRREKGEWASVEEHRRFFDGMAEERGIRDAAGWKAVTYGDVVASGGQQVLRRYEDSVFNALQALYPELEITDARQCRATMPRGYWSDKENVRRFLDEVAEEMGVKCAQDWRKVTLRDVKERGGYRLLRLHGDSLFQLLQVAYPEQQWDEAECRPQVGKAYWRDLQQQRAFLDAFAARHGIRSAEDWARVTRQQVEEEGGTTLLRRHATFFAALEAVYPEMEWNEAKCRPVVPKEYWEEETIRECMEHIREQLQLEKKEDWARVSEKHILDLGRRRGGDASDGMRVNRLLHHMTLPEALSRAYPTEDWSILEGPSGMPKKSAQWSLLLQVRRLFPATELVEDYLHPDISRETNHPIELDIFLPEHGLALYVSSWSAVIFRGNGPLSPSSSSVLLLSFASCLIPNFWPTLCVVWFSVCSTASFCGSGPPPSIADQWCQRVPGRAPLLPRTCLWASGSPPAQG